MEGRVITVARHVGLGDVRPDTTMRLDAIARVVQDAADFDAASAPVTASGVWLLRRLTIEIPRTPRFRADLSVRTWCSGVGARWAERRTDIATAGVHCVGATAIWVYVDPARGVPAALPAEFFAVWGASAGDRKVSARLVHDAPSDLVATTRWPLRATDVDVVGHVNNAAYWAPVEDELVRRGQPRVRRAEIEFRAGLDPSDDVEYAVANRADGFMSWLRVDRDVRASILVGCSA